MNNDCSPRQRTERIYGWFVSATPVVCGLSVYWLGVFERQGIPHKFATDDAVFDHVRNCLDCNIHPCKTGKVHS